MVQKNVRQLERMLSLRNPAMATASVASTITITRAGIAELLDTVQRSVHERTGMSSKRRRPAREPSLSRNADRAGPTPDIDQGRSYARGHLSSGAARRTWHLCRSQRTVAQDFTHRRQANLFGAGLMERTKAYLPTGFCVGHKMPADAGVLCTTRECRSSRRHLFLSTLSKCEIDTIRSSA